MNTCIMDLLESETFFILLWIVLGLYLIIKALVTTSLNENFESTLYGEYEKEDPIEEHNAKILLTKTYQHPLKKTLTIFSAIFEFENGKRVELAFKENPYGILVDGDIGTLKYAGKKFISFERNVISQQQSFDQTERDGLKVDEGN